MTSEQLTTKTAKVGWAQRAVLLVMLGAVVDPVFAQVQSSRDALPSLVPESLVGSVSFDLYCASCHGRRGKGDGPTAAALRTPPADLTTLAGRNGGTFPRDRVLGFVEGSSRSLAHGSPDMPVWGPTLRGLDASDARVTVRLRNMVAFVESIQESSAPAAKAPDPDGASLYRSFCATCHGASGHGDGVMAGATWNPPPNLTTLALRNGGFFPGIRVRRIVDGTGIASHGDRTMPVWGDVFMRSRGGAADAGARIDAILRFLESIQQRQA
jgi:cytochrome c553